MQLFSNDFKHDNAIPARCAFARSDGDGRMALAENLNPHLRWEGAPANTRSFALLCIDPDVPASAEGVNQDGVVLAADSARVDFYHWCMANIPAEVTELASGSCSAGVHLGGKADPQGPGGSQQGINDYTHFMAGSEMAGTYRGYDGPCPPWNDARMHHYHFTIFALDVEQLTLPENFSGQQLRAAMAAHVLAKASLVGSYTLYAPLLRAGQGALA